jgi:hypothetical protein
MNLERLGLILFIKYFKQIDSIRKHLYASLRELLLATSASFDITNQLAKNNLFLKKSTTLKYAFQKIDHIIQYSVSRLEEEPKSGQGEQQELKQNIVESIIAVIDEEIDGIQMSDGNAELKVEALNTVKTVLGKYMPHEDSLSIDDDILFEQISQTRS